MRSPYRQTRYRFIITTYPIEKDPFNPDPVHRRTPFTRPEREREVQYNTIPKRDVPRRWSREKDHMFPTDE